MRALLKRIEDNPAVQAIIEENDNLFFQNLNEEAVVVSSAFYKKPQNIVIIKETAYAAQRLYNKISALVQEENCALFVVEENLRVEAIAASPELTAKKIETLASLLDEKKRIIVTHAGAVIRNLCSPELFAQRCIRLKTDQTISILELQRTLVHAGYEKVSRVDQPLCFASRGGIVDVYSMNEEYPIRIEFFDNEIESIRYFDISTQRTIKVIDSVQLVPATELLFSQEDVEQIKEKVADKLAYFKSYAGEMRSNEMAENIDKDLSYLENGIKENHLYEYYAYLERAYSILDYVDHPLIIESTHQHCKDHVFTMVQENTEYLQERVQENQMLPEFQVFNDYGRCLEHKRVMALEDTVSLRKSVSSMIRPLEIGIQNIDVTLKMSIKDAKDYQVLYFIQDTECEELINHLINNDIQYQLLDKDDDEIVNFGVYFCQLDEGMIFEKEKMIIYSEKELFNKNVHLGRYANKFKEAEVLNDYQDLAVGDYIVHSIHGVGQYFGIITKEINGIHKDYLRIVYRGDDELFVPLEQFKLVRKFVSREGVHPKLNKLGSNEWEKTKSKIKSNVENIAERLINLYSEREKSIGFAYGKDTPEQIQFESEFKYELTEDQARSVVEIKEDMMSPKPMDRLLCGDVGFGKTEVAIRAAYKAVENGKQVAYLCPTTILSSQHYQTFADRFKNHAVEVRVINRFVPDSQVEQILRDLKEGKVDILIGTHRLLSKDVVFKDLGFLIIDEEQRFGVQHKEKIKEMKKSIDVLSLSATPIPRTLQMSLIGIRQLSQLDTPPSNRLPVQTYVIERNRNVINEVIERELARNGQVFYLYNNTSEIYNVAHQIQRDIPDAKVAVAHGKMNREDIEDVMIRFMANEYNILVCTTIIETGIDIPNANTILVDNADRFGLSQLYQIKGRVGRSDRLAYAYLMISERKNLSEVAQKRLQSIKEFTQLGSGYKIAMRDLTIRGAGDLLGAEQSGFIDTVGIDMYIEMLKEAVDEKKGIVKTETKEMAKAPILVDGYIPQNFAPEDIEKINLYQKIEKVDSRAGLIQLKNEIIDMYGKLPKAVKLLFEKKQLDILMADPIVSNFRNIKNGLEVSFTQEWSNHVDGIKLFELFTTISKDITLKYEGGKIMAFIPKINDHMFIAIEMLERAHEAEKEN